MGKRHLTPAEIKDQCKRIARESRMADRTPWTAMGIICSYVIMRREGFKGSGSPDWRTRLMKWKRTGPRARLI